MANEIISRDQNRITVLAGITDDSNLEVRMLRVDSSTNRLLVSSTGGGGFTFLTATGTVDGSNADFTFVSKPTYIVSDGAWYRENMGWTWSGSTATMSVPPQFDIWGFS